MPPVFVDKEFALLYHAKGNVSRASPEESEADPLNKPSLTPWRAIGLFGAIGFELAALIVIGLFAGRWLDRALGTAPVFLIAGILCGLFIGIISMIILIMRVLKGAD